LAGREYVATEKPQCALRERKIDMAPTWFFKVIRQRRRIRTQAILPILESLEDRTLPSFNAALDYPVGFGPHAIAAGDFSGNGKLDLATASFFASPGNISILMGNGDGTFSPAANVSLGAAPENVIAADFNGDGKLDLVTANYGNTVSVLLGNGNGTFQAPANYPAGTNPFRLAVADFNGDGKLDLVVDDRGPIGGNGAISILLGNGNGTFGVAFSITVTALDSFGNLAMSYRGTVHFSSTDGSALLPGDYQFTGADQGVHTFTVTLNTLGSQTVTATDTLQSHITGSATVTVTASATVSLESAMVGELEAEQRGREQKYWYHGLTLETFRSTERHGLETVHNRGH
jgi:hypothetical protein